MREQLISSTRVHLRFYRRNRLLWAVAFIMLMMASITLAFSLFMYSDAQKFVRLTGMFRTLNGYAFVFAPLLGLFVVSSHLRNKQIKIVVHCSRHLYARRAGFIAFSAAFPSDTCRSAWSLVTYHGSVLPCLRVDRLAQG